jgi:lipid-A-disaccharide synthase
MTYLLVKLLVTCRYMTLPNLIAGRAIMPEYPFAGHVADHELRMTDVLDGWICEPATLAATRQALVRLRNGIAQTGGVERAAEAIENQIRQVREATARAA